MRSLGVVAIVLSLVALGVGGYAYVSVLELSARPTAPGAGGVVTTVVQVYTPAYQPTTYTYTPPQAGVEDLSRAVSALSSELSALRSRLEALESRVSQAISALQANATQGPGASQAELEAVRRTLRDALEEISALKASAELLSKAVENLSVSLEGLRARVNDIDYRLPLLNATVTALYSMYQELARAVADLSQRVSQSLNILVSDPRYRVFYAPLYDNRTVAVFQSLLGNLSDPSRVLPHMVDPHIDCFYSLVDSLPKYAPLHQRVWAVLRALGEQFLYSPDPSVRLGPDIAYTYVKTPGLLCLDKTGDQKSLALFTWLALKLTAQPGEEVYLVAQPSWIPYWGAKTNVLGLSYNADMWVIAIDRGSGAAYLVVPGSLMVNGYIYMLELGPKFSTNPLYMAPRAKEAALQYLGARYIYYDAYSVARGLKGDEEAKYTYPPTVEPDPWRSVYVYTYIALGSPLEPPAPGLYILVTEKDYRVFNTFQDLLQYLEVRAGA